MSFKNILALFLVTDFLLVIISLIFGGYHWLINTQAGFIGAMLIVVGSCIGHKKMVDSRIGNFDLSTVDERDDVDKITDPYKFYEEEISEEKKKNSIENIKASFPGLVSPYRIGAYILFFIILFTLANQNLFLPIPFAIGISFVCVAALMFIIIEKYWKKI